ncbi:MAG: hypothetical protein ISN29_02525 [Gammaproteobacteria bacterium AqS3]|nr:hypothetical protein [Gammaproteobacteria bacterium AqS3]
MDTENIEAVSAYLGLGSHLLDYEIDYAGLGKQKSIAKRAHIHLEKAIAIIDQLQDVLEEQRIADNIKRIEEEEYTD